MSAPTSSGSGGQPLQLRRAARRFGRKWALRGVTLDVAAGEVVAVTGANGSGKSTLLRVAASAMTLTSGECWVFGHSVRRSSRLVRPLVGLLGHSPGLYEDLTVGENLEFAGRMLALGNVRAAVSRALEITALGAHATDRVKTLSSGWQKRVALARLYMQSPMLLLLDEPYNSLDPAGVEVVNNLIEATRLRDGATLVVTHSLVHAAATPDRCVSLRAGLLHDDEALHTQQIPGGLAPRALLRPDAAHVDAPLVPAEFP